MSDPPGDAADDPLGDDDPGDDPLSDDDATVGDSLSEDTPAADDHVGDEDPASTAGSTPVDADGEPAEGEQATVAAKAGTDEAVIDEPRELASTVRLEWTVSWAVGSAVIGAIATGLAFVVGSQTAYLSAGIEPAATVGAAVFALFELIGVVRALLLYRSWSYVVRADSLFLSRGVLTRVRTVVPYVRVQHIDTTRSPLERLLGLSTLVVYTAGSRGADVTIPGLTPEHASTLQQRLERLTIESEEDDAV